VGEDGGMALSIVRVEHPELFVGPPEEPEQIVRVTVAGPPGPVTGRAYTRGSPVGGAPTSSSSNIIKTKKL